MTRQDALAVTFDFSDPRRSAALAVGAAAAPFWAPLFATAAGAGVAWWWMTGWTRFDTRNPLVAATQVEPAPASSADALPAIDIEVVVEAEESSPADEIAAIAEQASASDDVVDAPTTPAAAAAPAATARSKGRKASKAKAASTGLN